MHVGKWALGVENVREKASNFREGGLECVRASERASEREPEIPERDKQDRLFNLHSDHPLPSEEGTT